LKETLFQQKFHRKAPEHYIQKVNYAGVKDVHSMLCQERKKWNSVVVRMGVVTDRNKEKQIKEDALREDIKRILVECLDTKNWRM